jgi:hypothetical protein
LREKEKKKELTRLLPRDRDCLEGNTPEDDKRDSEERQSDREARRRVEGQEGDFIIF